MAGTCGKALGDLRAKKISIHAQAAVINFELATLSAEVRKADKAREKYSSTAELPDMIKFLGSCFTGKSCVIDGGTQPKRQQWLGDMVFIMIGTDLSKLSAPVKQSNKNLIKP